MSEKNEKLLKPLRDICGKISEANGDVIKHLAELKKYSEKAAFYEFHVFVELLEVISQNQELLKPQLKDIFKLLNYILNNESRSKEPIISRLYNFIIHHKVILFRFTVCSSNILTLIGFLGSAGSHR